MTIPAVAYLRMSTDKQEASIPSQRTEVEAYARKHGYKIVREYVDAGISGDETEKRIQFRKMLTDATGLGDFEAILCWDQDRFGRFDPLEAGYWIKPLRDAGISLVTIAQGRIDWNEFQGRLLYFVQQEGKHAFLKDLSRNTLRGHLAAFNRGEWQTTPPFGYRLENKRLVPIEEEAAIVRCMFRHYADGMSLRSLAAWLNQQGIKSPRGAKWNFPMVRRILRNVAYIGIVRRGPKSRAKYNHATAAGEVTSGPADRNRPQVSERVECHEPLIDRQVFDKVQRLLDERKERANQIRRGKYIYMLSGLVRCAHCGARMTGILSGAHRSYRCTRYHLSGRSVCNRNPVREDRLLSCVVRKLQSLLTLPGNLERLKEALLSECKSDSGEAEENRQRLDKQIAELDHRIARGTSRLLTAPDTVYDDLLAELEKTKESKAKVLQQLESLVSRPAVSENDLKQTLAQALAILPDLDQAIRKADPLLVREAVGGLVSHLDLSFRQERRKETTKSIFERGVIHLRPNLQSVNGVTPVTPDDSPRAAFCW